MTLEPSARHTGEPTCAKGDFGADEPDGPRADVAWRKSSYSINEIDSDCVEVGLRTRPEAAVLVRDTKDREGPCLTFTPDAWASFVEFAPTAAG